MTSAPFSLGEGTMSRAPGPLDAQWELLVQAIERAPAIAFAVPAAVLLVAVVLEATLRRRRPWWWITAGVLETVAYAGLAALITWHSTPPDSTPAATWARFGVTAALTVLLDLGRQTVVFMLFPMSYVFVVDLASEVLEDQKGEDGDNTEQHP